VAIYSLIAATYSGHVFQRLFVIDITKTIFAGPFLPGILILLSTIIIIVFLVKIHIAISSLRTREIYISVLVLKEYGS